MISSSRLMPDDRDIVLHIRIAIENWWHLRKMNTRTATKATTAIVNATRNAVAAPSISMGNQVTWSLTHALTSIPNLYSEPIVPSSPITMM
jgi:hypothetical protein